MTPSILNWTWCVLLPRLQRVTSQLRLPSIQTEVCTPCFFWSEAGAYSYYCYYSNHSNMSWGKFDWETGEAVQRISVLNFCSAIIKDLFPWFSWHLTSGLPEETRGFMIWPNITSVVRKCWWSWLWPKNWKVFSLDLLQSQRRICQ